MDEKAKALELSRSAFPRASSRREHADIVHTRSRLPLYRDEDFPQALGEVIEDSIISYPDTADIECVIRFLDATGDTAGPHKARERRQEVVGGRSLTLGQLTNAQAKAIVAWLNYISGWPELKLDRYLIDAVLPYWSARAESRQS
jgi:hypothetical protein